MWDMLPDELQQKIIEKKNDLMMFNEGLYHFYDYLFGKTYIYIDSHSMFHIFYLDFKTLQKKKLPKMYDFNGNQFVNYKLDSKHKIRLYPYMLNRL